MGKERIYFKRSKYLINKNKENLKPEEFIKLETLLGKAKDLGYAYLLKECFRKVLKHALKKLSSSKVTILYSKLAVHSKCYIWRKNANIVTALVGSANFSVSGLENPYKEVLAETTFDTFAPLNKYLNIVLENCIPWRP